MNAKYNFGGVSKFLGVFKVRVGQGDSATRIKSMIKKGHTDIDIIEFSGKMTKEEICKELLSREQFKAYTDVINETLTKKTAVKTSKTKVAKPAVAKAPVKKSTTVSKSKATKSVAKAKPASVAKEKETEDFDIEELKQLAV
jgi:hypothetical protein